MKKKETEQKIRVQFNSRELKRLLFHLDMEYDSLNEVLGDYLSKGDSKEALETEEQMFYITALEQKLTEALKKIS